MRECWQLFVASQPFFLTTYVAYHFYRSHAWCVKSGLKLGVEFVLYRKGPEFFHAQCVSTPHPLTLLFSPRHAQARRHYLECRGRDEAGAAVSPPAQLGLGAERQSRL